MSATRLAPPAVDAIPLIDFAPFLNGCQADKLTVARQVRAACETIGFLYLRNHGVPDLYDRRNPCGSAAFLRTTG